MKLTLKDIRRDRKLGEGTFGSVEKLLLTDGRYAAGKSYHKSLLYTGVNTESVMRRFTSECQLLSQIHHPNIVEFIGIFFFHDSAPTLVMEFMAYNLNALINDKTAIEIPTKLHIIKEIATGLAFLHSRTPPLVHGDLVSRNIVLNGNATIVKISDIRNLQIVDPKKVPEVLVQSCYMPPEVDNTSPLQCGTPLDIFSFGHLALCAMIKQLPSLRPKVCTLGYSTTELGRRKSYMNILEDMLPNPSPLVGVIERCLDDDAQKRYIIIY